MNTIMHIKVTMMAGLSALALLFVSCSGEESVGPGTDNFDRRAMLTHWADEIIIPSLNHFTDLSADLEQSAGSFTDSPNETTLEELREAWEQAYLGFQWVSMFEIGPAMDVGGDTGSTFRDFLNFYPADTAETEDMDDTDIDSVVEEGSWNLELPSMRDHQGFPALDYLLYGLADTDEQLLATYQSGTNAGEWKAYLDDLASRIHLLASTVRDGWTDGYRDPFVSNDGGGANAAVDMMVNDYIYHYEKHLRAGKVGIPAGVLPGSSEGFAGTPLPGHVEAPYRGDLSRALLLEALNASEQFFRGTSFDDAGSGPSLRTYLDYVTEGGQRANLSSTILDQFEASRQVILALDENLGRQLSRQVEEDDIAMLQAYDALQQNVVYMKTDMVQALGVNIAYTDTDGD